jgi:hypothetical protein
VGSARSEDTVTCKDGTTSKGGQGACSGHGGVAKPAKKKSEEKEAKPAKEAKEKEAGGDAAAMVVCKDGTTSKGGQGACSGHGGIDKGAKGGKAEAPGKKEADEERSAAPAAPRAPAKEPPAAAAAKPAKEGASGGHAANTDPAGAIARCKDGTYSHAKGHSGACSSHGGVGEWMDEKK